MGKTARAAAREHHVHRSSGDESGEPSDVGLIAGAHVMVRAKEIVAKLDMLGQVFRAVAMDQQKFGQRCHLAPDIAPLKGMQRHLFIGMGDQ